MKATMLTRSWRLVFLLFFMLLDNDILVVVHAQWSGNKKNNDKLPKKLTLPKQLLESSIRTDEQEYELDPALHVMTYYMDDNKKEKKTTYVYIEPSLEQMYSHTANPPSFTKVQPKFNGLAGKFINLSKENVTLIWEASEGGDRHTMRIHEPFSASGTGTFPTHRFLFVLTDDEGLPDSKKKPLNTMIVGDYPHNLYYYDPYYVPNNPKLTESNLKKHLNKNERKLYDGWRNTLLFHEQYLNVTGRSYLANYLRPQPIHHMWRGDYFGQEHWAMTRETHFIQLPSARELQKIHTYGNDRILQENDRRILQQYRDPTTKQMNMTLKCVSVAPRVFEIPKFLSPVEVDHILTVATEIDLRLSKTGDGKRGGEDKTRTRTSYNSWVEREKSSIIDTIYRRAADLLRIDESLFRYRGNGEFDDIQTKKSIAEALQLVHYTNRQEYTAHHDFGYSNIDPGKNGQRARFATLLLYLNENMTGGETSFPRWVNGETFKQLKVIPEVGKAILFYSQLPDGNLDDFSQHAALPVTDGEKWLINLWVWDPVYE